MLLLFDLNAGTVEENDFTVHLTITGNRILTWSQHIKIFIISKRNRGKLHNKHIDKLVMYTSGRDNQWIWCGNLSRDFLTILNVWVNLLNLSHCLASEPPIKMKNGTTILPAVIFEKKQQTEMRGSKTKICSQLCLVESSSLSSEDIKCDCWALPWHRLTSQTINRYKCQCGRGVLSITDFSVSFLSSLSLIWSQMM